MITAASQSKPSALRADAILPKEVAPPANLGWFGVAMKLRGDQLLVWRLPGLWCLCLRSHRRQRCASGAGREEGGLTVLLQVCPYIQGMWGRYNCSKGGKQARRGETRASRAN